MLKNRHIIVVIFSCASQKTLLLLTLHNTLSKWFVYLFSTCTIFYSTYTYLFNGKHTGINSTFSSHRRMKK
jgi:hypothetical protein